MEARGAGLARLEWAEDRLVEVEGLKPDNPDAIAAVEALREAVREYRRTIEKTNEGEIALAESKERLSRAEKGLYRAVSEEAHLAFRSLSASAETYGATRVGPRTPQRRSGDRSSRRRRLWHCVVRSRWAPNRHYRGGGNESCCVDGEVVAPRRLQCRRGPHKRGYLTLIGSEQHSPNPEAAFNAGGQRCHRGSSRVRPCVRHAGTPDSALVVILEST